MKTLRFFHPGILTITAVAIMATSCGSEDVTDFNDTIMDDLVALEDTAAVDDEQLEEVIHAIPSPIEMTMLIRNSQAPYNAALLNETANYDKYTTSHQRALNLGVFGADLGYLNLYGKTGTSLEYLKTIKQLSEDLRVGQFFDFNKLKEISNNEGDMDSLITISTRNFSQMNHYLREQKRGKISVLIVTGTFIEGLHIASQIVKSNPIEPIKERVGEQKLTVEDMISILNVYKNDPFFADLITKFEALATVMDGVTIEIIEGEIEMKEVDGVLMAVGGDESKVIVTDKVLNDIINKVAEIRNNIVN